MTPETIIAAVSYLGLATGQPLDDDRVKVYVNQLADLKNEQLFADAVKLLANESKWMPTVAEIRTAYRELLMRRQPANALNAGTDSGWESAGGAYDDCLGDCGRKHRLVDLMPRNGYCRDCVPPETVKTRLGDIAPHFRKIGDAA